LTNSNDNRQGISLPNEQTPVFQTTATIISTSSSSSSLTAPPSPLPTPPTTITTKPTIRTIIPSSDVDTQISLTKEGSSLFGDVKKQQQQQQQKQLQQQPPSQPCPSCGRKAYIYLCSQIASSAKEFKRDIPSEDADTSLGIFLHYFLENHIHNLHYGVRLLLEFLSFILRKMIYLYLCIKQCSNLLFFSL
jgi:hypothetical protein